LKPDGTVSRFTCYLHDDRNRSGMHQSRMEIAYDRHPIACHHSDLTSDRRRAGFAAQPIVGLCPDWLASHPDAARPRLKHPPRRHKLERTYDGTLRRQPIGNGPGNLGTRLARGLLGDPGRRPDRCRICTSPHQVRCRHRPGRQFALVQRGAQCYDARQTTTATIGFWAVFGLMISGLAAWWCGAVGGLHRDTL
jgi:hypothetical protein